MKKYFMCAMVLVAIMLFVGCGKKGLVGKWASEGFSGMYVYTFNEDGTGSYGVEGAAREFTYTIKDDTISIHYKGDTSSFETTYKIEGNKLNIIDSFGSDTIYIRK